MTALLPLRKRGGRPTFRSLAPRQHLVLTRSSKAPGRPPTRPERNLDDPERLSMANSLDAEERRWTDRSGHVVPVDESLRALRAARARPRRFLRPPHLRPGR